MDDPDFEPNGGIYIDGDGWDMFQAERRELLEHIEQEQVENVVFTSGHTHIYLTSELHIDFDDPASVPVAADFVTGSLTADPDPLTPAPLDVLHFAENLMLKAKKPRFRMVSGGSAVERLL